MKLKVQEIPESGLHVEVDAPADKWLVDLLQVFGEDYPEGNPAFLRLDLTRTCDNVFVSGEMTVDLTPTCDRCLELFLRQMVIPVRLHLTPKLTEGTGSLGEEEPAEDEDFAFYQKEEIDLTPLLREIFLLAIPLRDLCREDCQGLCPRCGGNRNQSPCGC